MGSELLVAAGHWVGTNGFRMMPADAFSDHPATAIVAIAAGGSMTSLAYTWTHPDGALQDGILVFGPAATDVAPAGPYAAMSMTLLPSVVA